MRHCIETLLSAGERAEIILVDDGSVKDETPAICDEFAAKYCIRNKAAALYKRSIFGIFTYKKYCFFFF